MDNLIKCFSCLVLSCLANTTSLAAEFQAAKLVEGDFKVKYHSYRYQSAKNGGAMVDLVFVVNTEGIPTEIDVVRSRHSYFDRLAIRALKKVRYQSATYNGRPVESRQTARIEFDYFGEIASYEARVQSEAQKVEKPNFQFSSNRRSIPAANLYGGGSENTQNGLMLINRFLKEITKTNSQQKKANATLKRLERVKPKLLFSLFNESFLRFAYASKFGTEIDRLNALKVFTMYKKVSWDKRPTFVGGDYFTDEFEMLSLMISLGFYGEALELHKNLARTQPQLISKFRPQIDRIENLAISDEVVENKLSLSPRGTSFLNLFKTSFSLDANKQDVDAVELRCERKYQKLQFDPQATYNVPTSWGKCELQLSGEPGSSMTVLQL